ncbi:hypothetical protein LEL_10957 [Akanthomyces lecanii RCEF 1005]|uniref:Uncharacterized protein n=1 Tax=Akanthomyces lecanii RCEF 1005 TaxID=1081108 RepID=A0A167PK68_CORDF|nr:hypothetical protein LEL_10957 [Akanthomyces lecanii RCEF 1005]
MCPPPAQSTHGKQPRPAAHAAKRADGAYAAERLMARQPPEEDGHGARVDGAEENADNGHGHGVADDFGDDQTSSSKTRAPATSPSAKRFSPRRWAGATSRKRPSVMPPQKPAVT